MRHVEASSTAVYTAVTGNYNILRDPEFVSEGCDYVAFVDNPAVYKSSVWDVREIPVWDPDPIRASRSPKILPHLYLPDHQISLWVDANFRIVGDLAVLANEMHRNSGICFFEHPEGRSCVYEEAEACVKLGKAEPLEIGYQINHYRARGYPPGNGMVAGGCILRRHHEHRVVDLMEEWWREYSMWSARDQLSFPVAAWTKKANYGLMRGNIRNNDWLVWHAHEQKSRSEADARRILGNDYIFMSFPKSGRTWLRFFLAVYLEKKFGRRFSFDFSATRGTPSVLFTHNFFNHYQDSLGSPKIEHYKLLLDSNLIILVRDPLDTVVSYFHQKRYREQVFSGSLAEFALSPIYGIERLSEFVMLLLDLYERHRGRKFLASYESFLTDTSSQSARFIHFLFGTVDGSVLRYAVDSSSFQKMRDFEVKLTTGGDTDDVFGRLGLKGWFGDPESLKIRQGKIGSHKEEMGSDLAKYCANLPATSALLHRLAQLSIPMF